MTGEEIWILVSVVVLGRQEYVFGPGSLCSSLTLRLPAGFPFSPQGIHLLAMGTVTLGIVFFADTQAVVCALAAINLDCFHVFLQRFGRPLAEVHHAVLIGPLVYLDRLQGSRNAAQDKCQYQECTKCFHGELFYRIPGNTGPIGEEP